MLLARHRESSQRVACINNLRVIGQAIYKYHEMTSEDEKQRYLPAARIADGYATWAVLIAPHMIAKHPLHEWDKQRSYFEQTRRGSHGRPFRVFMSGTPPAERDQRSRR